MARDNSTDTANYDQHESLAELYDYVVPYRERQDVAFYVDMARQSGGPVLEIACGTGRVLIPTARAGIEIVGFDASQRMLEVCRRKLADEPPEVRAHATVLFGDMKKFELGRQFKLITIPFRPFQQMMTVEDQFACLACVRRHLAPGGRFILDIFNPHVKTLAGEDFHAITGTEPEFTMPDGRRVLRRHRFTARDQFAQVNSGDLIYDVTHPDGRQEQIVHSYQMRYMFRYEAEHLLARAGFAVESLYADYDRSPYGSKYPGELIFVVRAER